MIKMEKSWLLETDCGNGSFLEVMALAAHGVEGGVFFGACRGRLGLCNA